MLYYPHDPVKLKKSDSTEVSTLRLEKVQDVDREWQQVWFGYKIWSVNLDCRYKIWSVRSCFSSWTASFDRRYKIWFKNVGRRFWFDYRNQFFDRGCKIISLRSFFWSWIQAQLWRKKFQNLELTLEMLKNSVKLNNVALEEHW